MPKYKNSEQTRANLINAFWEIYKDKNIRDMTIGEVARKAGYHRATFYRHFRSLEEVLDTLEAELVFSRDTSGVTPEQFREIFLNFVNDDYFLIMEERSEYICKLVGPDGDPNFSNKCFEHLIDLHRAAFSCPENELFIDYAVIYQSGGVLAAFHLWEKRNREIPRDEMGVLLRLLNSYGPVSVLYPHDSVELKAKLKQLTDKIMK